MHRSLRLLGCAQSSYIMCNQAISRSSRTMILSMHDVINASIRAFTSEELRFHITAISRL
jgi:hypothetical protein